MYTKLSPNGYFVSANGLWRVSKKSLACYTLNMNTFLPPLRSCAAAICLLAVAALAQAQWGWKGADGRMVFSDQPPPQGVADKDITRRPAGSRAAAAGNVPATTSSPTASTPSGTGTASLTATAPKLSGKDAELDKRKKEIEAKEAADKKAQEAKVAEAKRENCDRAKRSKASFDSGTRVAMTNAKGEREVLNDAQRAEESKRLQGIISSDC